MTYKQLDEEKGTRLCICESWTLPNGSHQGYLCH